MNGAVKVKWARDPRAESGMKRLGIEYDIQDVPLYAINIEMSMERQARIGKKINDDWVLEYAQAMQDGAEFPMPILQLMKKENFHIWSGNHRINAAQVVGVDRVSAYVVKVTDLRMQDILPRVVNTWEGRRESREAVLEHARHICEKHALSPEEVAKMFGLQVQWLYTTIRANNVARQVEETGVKIDLPKNALILLSPLTDNKNVLRGVVKLFKDNTLPPSGADAKQIIEDVKKGNTERQRMAEVDRWGKLLEARKEKPATRDRPYRLGKRTAFVGMLTRMDKFLSGIEQASQLQLDDTDVKIVAGSWQKIFTKMDKLLNDK